LGKARRDLVERGGGGEVGEAGAFGGRLAVEAGAGCLGGELVGVTPEGRKLGRACSRGRAVGAQDRGGHVGGLAGRPAGVVDGLGQLGGELGDGGGGLAHGADQGAAVGHRALLGGGARARGRARPGARDGRGHRALDRRGGAVQRLGRGGQRAGGGAQRGRVAGRDGDRVRDRVGRDQEAPPLAGRGGRAAWSVAW